VTQETAPGTQRLFSGPGCHTEGMWFLILLGIVAVCTLAYINRVKLLAKVLGQSETRINRQLKRKPR
jgi:hypothetical protein